MSTDNERITNPTCPTAIRESHETTRVRFVPVSAIPPSGGFRTYSIRMYEPRRRLRSKCPWSENCYCKFLPRLTRVCDISRRRSRRDRKNELMVLEAASLTALAALAGSAVGGTTSFLSTWLAQGAQTRAQLTLHDKGRRQDLYREFVLDASKLFIEAVTSDTPDLSKTIALYALISRMRILSSQPVIDEAHKVAQVIVDSYAAPNKTFNDLRQMMVIERALDPLRGFSEACRKELHDL